MVLDDNFAQALAMSFTLHKDQVRKTAGTPYYAHLMSVAAIVIENGGDQNTAIAALLHDAVEDQGGEKIAKEIRATFGDEVADIVMMCSDSVERLPDGEKLPWKDRKEAHINHLKSMSPDTLSEVEKKALLVMCADKLHNARATYESVLIEGDSVYDRFRGGKQGTIWFMKSMARQLMRLTGRSEAAKQLADMVSLLDDISSKMKKIIVLKGYHSDSFYDASTPLLEKRSFAQMFKYLDEDLNSYKALKSNDVILALEREIDDVAELRQALEAGRIPSSLAFDVGQRVKGIDHARNRLNGLKEQSELYRQAKSGDLNAIMLLMELRNLENESWSYEYLNVADEEEQE